MLWSEAILDFGLTEELFFSLTPRQFYWLRERQNRLTEHEELLHAITTSTLANHSMCAPKKPYVPHDFMPSKISKKNEKKARDTAPKKRWTRKAFGEELFALGRTMCNMNSIFVMAKPKPKEPEEQASGDGNN
jgi:hypothetical protein